MSGCRLVVDLGTSGAARSISINLRDRSEALLVAQRYDGPSELWDGGRRVCTISRSHPSGMWVIS